MKVFVYFNLHRRLFSVRALEGPNKGRVIAHSQTVFLEDVEFKVSEAGRQRVLKEQKKNVHAGARGTWLDRAFDTLDDLEAVTYNPYKYTSFVKVATEEPVVRAPRAVLTCKKIWALI
jgi:hypothetical protein